jgi:hypothetical protein
MMDLNQTVSTDLPGMDQPGAADFYRTGLGPGLNFLEGKYGTRWFLLFLVGSLLVQAIWGPRRITAWLVLGWALPMAVYFLYFLPYKSYHYWLPVMVPLYSGGLGFIQVIHQRFWTGGREKGYRLAGGVGIGLAVLVLAIQFMANAASAVPDWIRALGL